MLNISIDAVYPTISTPAYYLTPLQVKGGVITLNQANNHWLGRYPDTWVQGLALETFGVSVGHTLTPYPVPALANLGVFWAPNCALGTDVCMQFYLIQAPPYRNDVPALSDEDQPTQPQRPPLLRLYQTPIYHIYFNKYMGDYYFPSEKCRQYGYPTNGLIMCAKEYETSDYRTALSVSTFRCSRHCANNPSYSGLWRSHRVGRLQS